MLSIVTVSYNCMDFIKLLIQSLRRFSTWSHEILVIDNASSDGSQEWLKSQPDIRIVPLMTNIGHGRGLDMALDMARYDYCLILDADSHVQRIGYEDDLLTCYQRGPNVRLVAAKGTHNVDMPDAKPIHAAFMFFKTQIFKDFKLSFIASGRHDVGRKIFYDLRDTGFETVRIESGIKFYSDTYGDNYYFNDKPTIYHNWYSSRMWKKDRVDNYEREDFERNKRAVFDHPFVKEILAWQK